MLRAQILLVPLTIISSVFLASCASYEARPFQTRPASSLVDRYEKDAFAFAARLPEDEDYLERHLGIDPIAYGLLPIAIFLENRNDTDNFEILIERASYRLVDGTELEPVPLDVVLEATRYSGWRSLPAWPLLLVPGMMVLSSVSSANEAMRDDYAQKVLVDINLPPRSDPVHGVIFFR